MNDLSQSQHFEPKPMVDGPIDHDQNPHKANRAVLATLTIATLGVAACSQESAASTNEKPVPATSEAPDSVDTTVALDAPVVITTEAPVETEPEQETTTTTPTTSAPASTVAATTQPEAMNTSSTELVASTETSEFVWPPTLMTANTAEGLAEQFSYNFNCMLSAPDIKNQLECLYYITGGKDSAWAMEWNQLANNNHLYKDKYPAFNQTATYEVLDSEYSEQQTILVLGMTITSLGGEPGVHGQTTESTVRLEFERATAHVDTASVDGDTEQEVWILANKEDVVQGQVRID